MKFLVLYYQLLLFGTSFIIEADETNKCEVDTILILADFFASTNGPAWTKNDGWLKTTAICSWHGITCSQYTHGDVTEINLSENKLDGKIPESLGRLTSLKKLVLSK